MGPYYRLRLLCICVIAVLLGACASAPSLPPGPGDCVTARLWSNGWHTDIALPSSVFEENHALRARFPEARYFLIGWGERDFYMAEEAGFWKGLKAIVPPSPSVLHVVAVNGPIETLQWRASDYVEFALSETGARRMAAVFAGSLVYDEEGTAVELGPGRAQGRSVFLADRANFHLFYMCNHWAAARLRDAGVPVRSALSFTAPALMNAVRREAVPACPASETPDF